MAEKQGTNRWVLAGCLVVFLAVVGAGVAGIVAVVGGFLGSGSAPAPAASVHDYVRACGNGLPGSAPYRPGAGPHPIAVFKNSTDGGDLGTPEELYGAGDVLSPTDPRRVQLVACSERTGDEVRVGSCPFRDRTFPLVRTTVEVTVYDAATGEQVGEPIRLPADSPTCPGAVLYDANDSDPVVYATPTDDQYVRALTPFTRA